jgi:hypothetical protein
VKNEKQIKGYLEKSGCLLAVSLDDTTDGAVPGNLTTCAGDTLKISEM